jgi:regulator of sirC expression with transglutaminase-like and TPR domain
MGRSGDGVPVGSIWLEPGQSRQVDLELFPQAGSNYPVRLVVRSNFERREKMELTPSQPHETLIP